MDINKKDRSFSNDPKEVISFAKEMIKGMHEEKVLVTLKHFPGIGSALVDIHFDLAILNKKKEEIENFDMRPFVYLKDEADLIMVSHILVPSLDNKNIATFSNHNVFRVCET